MSRYVTIGQNVPGCKSLVLYLLECPQLCVNAFTARVSEWWCLWGVALGWRCVSLGGGGHHSIPTAMNLTTTALNPDQVRLTPDSKNDP